jgi:GTPase SAR1 family protein
MDNTNEQHQHNPGKSSDIHYLDEKESNKELYENQAKINQSGNSNVSVNVNVEVDTKAIAYAILCSSLAKKELTNAEFEFALKKLDELTSKKNKEESQATNEPAKSSHKDNPSPWDKLLLKKVK